MKKYYSLFLFSLSVSWLFSSICLAELSGDRITHMFYPVADTCVRALSPNNQYGGDDDLFCEADSAGQYAARPWLKFDIADLTNEWNEYFGTNAWIITEVRLWLNEYAGYSWDSPGPVNIYHESNDIWEEGSGNSSPANGNELCWNNEIHFITNGIETLVGEFNLTAGWNSHEILFSNTVVLTDLKTNGTVSFRLYAQENAKSSIYSKEDSYENNRPRLYVTVGWTGTVTKTFESIKKWDFESADQTNDFITYGLWEWGTPTNGIIPTSGSNCWGTVLNGPHPTNNYHYLRMSFPTPFIEGTVRWNNYINMTSGSVASVYLDNESKNLTNTLKGWESNQLFFSNENIDLFYIFAPINMTNPSNLPGFYIDDIEVGKFTIRGQGKISLDHKLYTLPSAMQIEVIDAHLNTSALISDVAQVTIFSQTESSGETITLFEAGTNSSLFTNVVFLTSGTAISNGLIETSNGETVIVYYADLDNGFGVPYTFSAEAEIDAIAPTISNVKIENISDDSANASWAVSSDAEYVYLDWGTNILTTLREDVDDNYFFSNLKPLTEYYFRIIAIDTVGNTTTNDNSGSWFSFRTYLCLPHFKEKCDHQMNWDVSNGEWELGSPKDWPYGSFSGTNCWGTRIDCDYANNADSYLMVPSFPKTSNSYMRFAHIFDLESNFDYGYVETSYDQTTWSTSYVCNGLQSTWKRNIIDFSYRNGIRWRFESDGSITKPGWFIDDIEFGSYCNSSGVFVTDWDYLWDYPNDGNFYLDIGETCSVVGTVHNFTDISMSNIVIQIESVSNELVWTPDVTTCSFLNAEDSKTIGPFTVTYAQNASTQDWHTTFWIAETSEGVFTNYLLTHSSKSSQLRSLLLHIQNENSETISGAYIWLGPESPIFTRSDANGKALVEGLSKKELLLVVRHPDYGRIAPQLIDLNQISNIIITLPELTTIRIASYNLKAFGSWDISQIQPLVRTIWTVQPDVLCLQECPEFGMSLDEFQRKYLFGYTNIVSSAGGSIHNGIISFYPLSNSFSHGSGAPMTRDLFGSEIDVPKLGPVTFMSVHFKAFKDQNSADKRNQEAAFTGLFCSNLFAQNELFVLNGDFNEELGDPTWLSDVHDILNNAGAGLVTLTPKDDQGSTVTFPGWGSRLDYIMPLFSLTDHAYDNYVYRTETMNSLPTWLTHDDSGLASDHLLIYSEIVVIPEPLLYFWIMLLLSQRLFFLKNRIY